MRDSMAPALLALAALACLCLLWSSGCGGSPGDGSNGGDNGHNGGTGTTLSGTVVNAEDVTQPIAGAAVPWASVTAASASARQATTTNASGLVNLTSTPDDAERDPVWSPDGSRILFWPDRDSVGGRLHVMNADGSGVIRLADVQPTGEPSWAPDSLRVAFSAWYDDPQPGLWVGYANGSPARRLTTDTHDYGWLAWPP